MLHKIFLDNLNEIAIMADHWLSKEEITEIRKGLPSFPIIGNQHNIAVTLHNDGTYDYKLSWEN